MPKVYGIHHTQLDSLSVAPYDVRTLFGINGGPLEMASDFFPPSLFLAHNCLKMATGRKWRSWLKWSKFDVYQLSHHIPPRQCPESLRQPPDTSQTPYKHPKIWHILTNQRQLGEKEAAISFDSIQFIYVVTVLLNIFTEQHLNDWWIYWLYFLTIMWYRTYRKTIVCVYVYLLPYDSSSLITKKVSMYLEFHVCIDCVRLLMQVVWDSNFVSRLI